jgi:EmrB/QacA subfamily drug resistance transporter
MNYRPSPLALLVAGAFFMEFLDGSIIATALPSMAVSLHSSAVSLNVGISAYLMTVAVFILPSGWAAQRYGTRAVFATAVAVFTLGSVLCGISGSAHVFIAARVLQGLGGAMMVPVGRLAVLRTTPKHKLIGAIAVLTWPGLTAPVLAPPLAGFLTVYASWRWIFFINVPFGVMAFLLALRLVPSGRGEARTPFDLLGFALGATACLAMTRLLDLLGENGAPFTQPLLLVVAFGALFAWFLHHIRHRQHPLIDLAPLGVPTFHATLFGGGAMRTVIATMPFLLPLLFQLGFGMDAFHAGLLVIALFAGNIGIKPLTTPIIRRWGFRQIFLVNGMIQAVTMLACALLSPATPVPVILVLLVISGASRSLQFTSINTLAYADVPERMMSPANTMFSITYQLSQGFGVALGAIALRLAYLGSGSAAGVPGRTEFHFALIGLAIVMALISLTALRLPPDAGDVVRLGKPASDQKDAAPSGVTSRK